jgi:methionine-S-sulfoxide reductase
MAQEIATLAGGCFWCLEAVYDQLKGVSEVESGYAGGHVKNPTYAEVCNKTTGHAEVIRLVFDNDVIKFDDILDVFFTIHDPTTLNRQGNDAGPLSGNQLELWKKLVALGADGYPYASVRTPTLVFEGVQFAGV